MEKDILSSTVFIFNRAKGTITPAGEQLTPGTINKIYQAMDEFRAKVREHAKEPHTFLDREETKSFITLHTLGLDTVALAYNGVAIAYATASPDGGIHMKGDDVPVGDKKALKMASAVQEKLQDCSIFGQWLDKAIEILQSKDNINMATKVVERKAMMERSMSAMKMVTKKIIHPHKTMSNKKTAS